MLALWHRCCGVLQDKDESFWEHTIRIASHHIIGVTGICMWPIALQNIAQGVMELVVSVCLFITVLDGDGNSSLNAVLFIQS